MTRGAVSPAARVCPSVDSLPPDTEHLVGLALSGGGIRSATFCLGALQAFERRNLLRVFDYLSTVSGGGFCGGWWSAWLARPADPNAPPPVPPPVFPEPEELEPARQSPQMLFGANAMATPVPGLPDGSRSATRRDPIHHLRLFSNYLTPRKGAFSADTWRAATFFVRNLALNWLVLLPLLLAAIVAGQLYFVFFKTTAAGFVCSTPHGVLDAGACVQVPREHGQVLVERLQFLVQPFIVALLLLATLSVLWLIHAAANAAVAAFGILGGIAVIAWLASTLPVDHAWIGRRTAVLSLVTAVATLVMHGIVVVLTQTEAGTPHDAHRTRLARWQTAVLGIGTALLLVLAFSGFGHEAAWYFLVPHEGFWAVVRQVSGWTTVLAAVAAALFVAYQTAPSPRAPDSAGGAAPATNVILVVAPYLVAGVLGMALALAGHATLRWWLERGNAAPLSWSVGGASLIVVGLAGYEGWLEIRRRRENPPPPRRGPRAIVFYALSAVVIGLGGVLLGWPLIVGGHERRLASLAAAGVCAIIAAGSLAIFLWNRLRDLLGDWIPFPPDRRAGGQLPERILVLLLVAGCGFAIHAWGAAATPFWIGAATVVLAVSLALGIGWVVDPNMLSLHGFYKARLVRAYLGASNTNRKYDDVTDTAPGDDVLLTHLRGHADGVPYHLINTTLNLVGSPDLAVAQRLSASFVLSRYYCGSSRTGYRCTADYMNGRLSLGTAVAVSGAAASPNMGARTPNSTLAMLMAILNVRLGFWSPTPQGARWQDAQPRLWPIYLMSEAFSRTTDTQTFCYLTDGGHFDNTGIYSLVERGCRHIVVLDCGADPRPSFADIGEVIRRCRIDFGAEIILDVDALQKNARNLGQRHYVIGEIVYDQSHWRMLGWDVPNRADRTGKIVWIKPAVVPGDTADVRQYQLENTVFPQQTTMDQWYDEAQFESYRKLGYDSAGALPEFTGPLSAAAVHAYFQGLTTPP